MIKDILKELNIESEALGGSSGEYWFGNGKSISSFSPVDGKEIGHVSTVTVDEYDQCIDQAHEAFLAFEKFLPQNEVRWSANWEMRSVKRKWH